MAQAGQPTAIPEIDEADIPLLMRALASGTLRVERVNLSSGTVWIKRYGRGRLPLWLHLHKLLARLVPLSFLRPSPVLGGPAMLERETRRIADYRRHGIAVPDVVYASPSALVLQDVGETMEQKLNGLRATDPTGHDALLVHCAAALGRVHAAGLSHGRPHPRDMFERTGEIGFFDFEEAPETVMPLATAQARDIWLLFLQIATRARLDRTCDEALLAWQAAAPEGAQQELNRMMTFLCRFLPLARLIGRVRMGSDLRRFIMATEYLNNSSPGKTVAEQDAQGRTG